MAEFVDALPATLREQAPIVLLLGFILWSGARRLWVFGWVYDDTADRARRLEDLLDRSSSLASRATVVAENVVKS